MSDAAWTAFSLLGGALLTAMTTIAVAIVRIVGELLGKKNEKSLREIMESQHRTNTERMDKFEESQEKLENAIETGLFEVRRDVDNIKNTIYTYHPREA